MRWRRTARLAGEGIRSRVVSMPCWELFEQQPQSYRDTVLPPTVRARVSIEAAAPFGWERYVGLEGAIIGVERLRRVGARAGRDARVRLHAGARRRDREKNSWNELMMIKKILCAIDRSPSSLQAFGYAIALAKWQRARLNLLEVIEEAPPPGVSRAPKSDGVPNETRTALERDLRRVLTARRASDVKVEIFMRKGNVVQEILAQAKASRSDLVVTGSHGRGGVQRLVLGSVAEKVLRLATCPVLTVRRGVRLVTPKPVTFQDDPVSNGFLRGCE